MCMEWTVEGPGQALATRLWEMCRTAWRACFQALATEDGGLSKLILFSDLLATSSASSSRLLCSIFTGPMPE